MRRESLIALTQRLIEVESVDADELKHIIDEHSPGPLVVPGTLPPAGRTANLEPPEGKLPGRVEQRG